MNSAQPVLSDKQVLRKRIVALREQLALETRATQSARITERLLRLPEYRQADSVLGYMNFGTEYVSESWIRQVLDDGKKLALPRVNRHADRLDLYWVDDLEDQLVAGLWGIREPIVERCERIKALNEIEFALLPGVAFSRDGGRLGYGGGYYDKLLARTDGTGCPVLVAAAFAMQVVEQIPQEVTDVKVGWIITEQETIACSNNVVKMKE